MSNDYTWWRNALAGQFGPVHEGEPQCGFYRRKTKDGRWVPVAIWFAFDNQVAVEGSKEVDPAEVWTWVCKHPVSHEAYQAALEGKGWPDEIAPLSNNAPADEADADEIESAIAAALAELQGGVLEQSKADKLAAHRERLSGLYKAQEAKRKAEKSVHDEAAKAVQAKYAPVLERIEETGLKIKAALTEWLKKAAPEGQRAKAGGTTARTVSLRTTKRAEIISYTLALEFFANSPEVREAVEKLANRAVKAGQAVPGVKTVEEQVAA